MRQYTPSSSSGARRILSNWKTQSARRERERENVERQDELLRTAPRGREREEEEEEEEET